MGRVDGVLAKRRKRSIVLLLYWWTSLTRAVSTQRYGLTQHICIAHDAAMAASQCNIMASLSSSGRWLSYSCCSRDGPHLPLLACPAGTQAALHAACALLTTFNSLCSSYTHPASISCDCQCPTISDQSSAVSNYLYKIVPSLEDLCRRIVSYRTFWSVLCSLSLLAKALRLPARARAWAPKPKLTSDDAARGRALSGPRYPWAWPCLPPGGGGR